jgi:hypothetical protein
MYYEMVHPMRIASYDQNMVVLYMVVFLTSCGLYKS